MKLAVATIALGVWISLISSAHKPPDVRNARSKSPPSLVIIGEAGLGALLHINYENGWSIFHSSFTSLHQTLDRKATSTNRISQLVYQNFSESLAYAMSDRGGSPANRPNLLPPWFRWWGREQRRAL